MIAGSYKSESIAHGPSPAFWIAWVLAAVFAFAVIGIVSLDLLGWGIFVLATAMLP